MMWFPSFAKSEDINFFSEMSNFLVQLEQLGRFEIFLKITSNNSSRMVRQGFEFLQMLIAGCQKAKLRFLVESVNFRPNSKFIRV